MKDQIDKVLIYGYGNPGRQDDGLGIMLVDHMEQWATNTDVRHVSFDSNYQLNIEDASLIKDFDIVVFVDASIEEIDAVRLTNVVPSQKTEFTMHAMAPEFILHLCQTLYNKYPVTYLLHIKGYQFNFLAEPTKSARCNLDKGIELIKGLLKGKIEPSELLSTN